MDSDKNLNLLEKKIRSRVIRRYMETLGIKKAVCFTCGNSAKALRAAGVDVLSVGENEQLRPSRWFEQEEIALSFPSYFNASSGDLPIHLMTEIAQRMSKTLGNRFQGGAVKVGSGETLLVLTLAYPELQYRIKPYRDNSKESQYDEGATLNGVIAVLYPEMEVPSEP
jgi:hypothetical protein